METTNPLAVDEESFEPTDAELVILNASDREIEEMQAATKLELLNLQVAAIAGWTDIKEWNPDPKRRKPVKVYQGTNLAHPELGIFIPNYVESIDAIAKVFGFHNISWNVDSYGSAATFDPYVEVFGETPAIALCNLLLVINPPLATPRRQTEVKIIDDDGEIESQVLEASFG